MRPVQLPVLSALEIVVRRISLWLAVSLTVAHPGPLQAQQQDGPASPEELQKLVVQLNERIAELERRLAQQEAAAAGRQSEDMQLIIDQLLARIETLEKTAAGQNPAAPPPPRSSAAQPAEPPTAQPPPAEPPPAEPEATTAAEGDADLHARVRALEEKQSQFGPRPHELQAFWQDGLRLETRDGDYKFRIGGRLNVDGAFFNPENGVEQDVGEDLNDGVEFRRARLAFSGVIHERFSFEIEFDFADGDAAFKDVYIGLLKVPLVGDVLVGHFKEPMGLEQVGSDNWTTFMERSTVTDALTPERNTGIAFYNRALDERITWALGAFAKTDDFGNGSFHDGLHFTGRVTGLPWYEQDGRYLLHLGLSYSHQEQLGAPARFRSRPESHLAPNFLDTGEFDAATSNVLGTEAAVVLGSLAFQGEFLQSWLDGVTGSNPQFNGFYVQSSYVLTGEHRLYDKRRGVFLGVKPRADLTLDGCGWGAWEAAARYSHTDLDSGAIDGGELDDFTFGLNWYLNPNVRIMFNYVLADLEDGGYTNIFQWRFQLNL
jgi:phosphate-selective porin OprO/OprP